MTQEQKNTIDKLDQSIAESRAEMKRLGSTSYFYYEAKTRLERVVDLRRRLLADWS